MKEQVLTRYVNVYRKTDGSLTTGLYLFESESAAEYFAKDKKDVTTKEIKITL